MHTKTILTAATIALAAGIGSASADSNFTTLVAVSADPLSVNELAKVRGAHWVILLQIRDGQSRIDLNDAATLFGLPSDGGFNTMLVADGRIFVGSSHGH